LRGTVSVRPSATGCLDLVEACRNIAGGVVAASLTVAFSLSYAALMFAGDLTVHLPTGMDMALTTSAVTAIVVALLGTIPFAITGADSATVAPMATMLATIAALLPAGLSADAQAATLFASLTLASAITGLGLFALGQARAAVVVRYVPFPLVAGFMAANGWLIVGAAVHLATDVPFRLAEIHRLGGPEAWPKFAAMAAFAALLTAVMARTRHFLALPLLLALGIGLAHAGFAWLGLAPAAARGAGWLFADMPQATHWAPWLPAAWTAVQWSVLVDVAPEMVAVLTVGALAVLMSASSLEVAAGCDSDLNQELRAQGQATLASAALGGFAGSVSLSRSLVNRAAGGTGRLSAVVCGLCAGLGLLYGAQLISLLPKLVLAGLLAFAGVQLLWNWLFVVRSKLQWSEYLTILAILVVVARYGYATGIGLGILAGCVTFAVRYARTPIVKHHMSLAERRSRVDRSTDASVALSRLGATVPILQLQGFLFFGSAHGLQQRVKALLPGARAVILDFKLVSGLDSSTAFSFQKMLLAARAADVTLVFAGLNDSCRAELARAGIIAVDGAAEHQGDLDQALEHYEELLLVEGRGGTEGRADFAGWLAGEVGSREAARALATMADRVELQPGDALCRQGEPTDALLFIDRGRVNVILETEDGRRVRLRVIDGRTVLGEMGFFMNAPRSATVLAESATVVYRLSREAHARLLAEVPEAAQALTAFVIRLLAERLKIANNLVVAYER
jgi:SulP family sulfate permease